ncbi:MAG: hypothetical protein Q8O97_00140 [bacterium]|nr:hypothetical protein [bacterium]
MVVAHKSIRQGLAELEEEWRVALALRDNEIIPALIKRNHDQAACLKEWQNACLDSHNRLKAVYKELDSLEAEAREMREALGNGAKPSSAPQFVEMPPEDFPHPPKLPVRADIPKEEKDVVS